MDIRSILVNVDIDVKSSTALKAALGLAEKFGAQIIAVAADEPELAYVGIENGAAAADFYAVERGEIEKRLIASEAEFRALLPQGTKADWRPYVAPAAQALIENARCADLIVTAHETSSAIRAKNRVDLGEIVLAAGRPVIDLAEGATSVETDKIVIGWKDTREARRAVADALPFLQRAKDVIAVTVSEGRRDVEQASLDDLRDWLDRHGVKMRQELAANEEGFIDVLESTARAYQADLLITGGYGHSRMREWLFGGITRNLLQANTLNRFFSN